MSKVVIGYLWQTAKVNDMSKDDCNVIAIAIITFGEHCFAFLWGFLCKVKLFVTENMDVRSEEDKLKELKNFVLGVMILKNKSEDDWKEYQKKNDQEWIKREAMVILLTEELINLMADKSKEDVLDIFYPFLSFFSVSSQAVQCSLVRLCTSVSNRVGGRGDRWNGHRVFCWVVGWMNEHWGYRCNENTKCSVMDYLVKLLECKDKEMVKWAILTGEMWWMKKTLGNERRNRLLAALTLHTTQTHIDTIEETTDLDLLDAEWYQVKSCAMWCKDNLVGEGVSEVPELKLSRDRFDVRRDKDNSRFFGLQHKYYSPVRSPFSVKSNVYFYEMICLTNGKVQVGWTSRESRILNFNGIGNDDNSIGLEIGRKCFILSNSKRHPISTPLYLCPINVVGCLLDVDNQKFEFYLNGRILKCSTPPIPPQFPHLFLSSSLISPPHNPQLRFSPPYFATARLSPHQQCHFNFGQSPFKYPPQNIRFTTFDKQSRGDVRKYRLGKTENCGDYWFKHTLVGNQLSLFFDDEIQNKLNQEVARVEEDIENDREIGEWGMSLVVNRNEGCKGTRYIQAIIEVIGKIGGEDKVDVIAQWIGRAIEKCIDQVHNEQLLELLYHYLQLVPIQSTLTKHRSICIVLLHLIKCQYYRYYKIKDIRSSVFAYLIRTLTSTSDEWTQLFVLIALVDLEMSKDEKKEIESCGKISVMLKAFRNEFKEKNALQLLYSKNQKHMLHYQLYLSSHKLRNAFTPQQTVPFPAQNHAILNPHDLTAHITLSPCHLSARSDWHWQSVRSVCHVSAQIYYFEVLLLTAGPMTIGWATKRTEIKKIGNVSKIDSTIMIGFDEFSIGFDGYNRCIYHDNKTYQLKDIPRWKAGDIAGCLIDTRKKHFKFYLNGNQINFKPKPKIYFSTQPYHSLLSLSQFQQCYINFGQSPFSSHRPKYIDFCDFYSNKPEVQEIQSKTIVNFQNAILEKNVISINSNIELKDLILSGNGSTLKRSAESAETIGNISSVQTLAKVNVDEVDNSQIKLLRMQCRICNSSPRTKLVRFVCCDTFPLCLDCIRTMTECPKCKKQSNDSQTDNNPSNHSKLIHCCTLCTNQQAEFRFIACDHFNLCKTCVNQILFKDCPRCQKP